MPGPVRTQINNHIKQTQERVNLELIEDIDLVILAIREGDLDDAIEMLEEIKEEYGLDEHLRFFPN